MSKTPQFNKALDEILNSLKSGQKTCQQCGHSFDIFAEDIEFYKKLMVSPPKLCFECRKQRKFGFYNNILKFYKKECVAHPDEKVISTFPSESPYKIFDLHYWWSDKWGAEDYGKDYDLSRPFFKQFQELNLTVPHPAITHYWQGVVDSPYTISVINTKNCYLSSVAGYLENVHYSYWAMKSKDCLDSLNFMACENSYELITCNRCYQCKFCQDCDDCIDSVFLYNCKNCQSCFGCTNLRNKNYCFFNEQLTKEDYNRKIKDINLGDRDVFSNYIKKFEEVLKKSLRRNVYTDRKNINCFGDRVEQAKNCYLVFRGDYGLDNLRYCVDVVLGVKDSMDLWIVGPSISLSYEVVEAYDSSSIKFSYFIRDGLELEYCLECHNCQYCFGCIGLRNKKYHIFNKPYSEDEYWKIIDKIKIEMLKREEYGEFFPLSMALHPYNDTYAIIEFPLTKEDVEKNGWQWHKETDETDIGGLELMEAKNVAKDIKEVNGDILKKAIVCEVSKKPFRLIKPELDFYKGNNLSVPMKHPYQRLVERFQKRNPAKLWKSICAKCQKEMHTSYPPEKQKEFKIYCEECYLKEVV